MNQHQARPSGGRKTDTLSVNQKGRKGNSIKAIDVSPAPEKLPRIAMKKPVLPSEIVGIHL
jgi:hypothetical protein